jgi:hypothetical protein
MGREPRGVTLMGRYRVVRGPDVIGTFPDLEAVETGLRGARPGRYVIEEVAAAGGLLPSGYSAERWGVAMVWPDGSVELEPERPA